VILSALLFGLTPTVLFQEPEETKLEAAKCKVGSWGKIRFLVLFFATLALAFSVVEPR
jgi:hypothetical protein